MSRDVYEKSLRKATDDIYVNVKCDVELVAELTIIRTSSNPAEIMRICENVSEMKKSS